MADEQIKGSASRARRLAGPVREARQFEVLADATRWAIYTAIGFAGAHTIRDVAERMNRRPSTLYRHFDALEEAGLLEVIGEIETERRPARVYAAPRNPRLLYDAADDAAVEALSRIVASAARHAARSTARAFESRTARARGPERDTHVAQVGGWLTREERQELNRKLDDLVGFLRDKERREGTTLQHLSAFLWPGGGEGSDDDPNAPRGEA